MKMKFLTTILSIVFAFTANSLFGQAEESARLAPAEEIKYSTEDLTKYAKVTNDIVVIQEELEAELDVLLEDVGLEKEIFTKMAEVKMQGGDMSGFTNEQQAAFEKVQGVVMQKQLGIKTKMMGIAKKHDLDLGTYRAMSMAISADKTLAQKVKKIAEGLKNK